MCRTGAGGTVSLGRRATWGLFRGGRPTWCVPCSRRVRFSMCTSSARIRTASIWRSVQRSIFSTNFTGTTALKVARVSAAKQHADGSWYYGERPSQRWIDNFHTGYNLCALQSICRDAGTTEFGSSIRRGFEFYRPHFFRKDGAPGYFHNRTYPIDIHCVAQSIITLLAFRDLEPGNAALAHSVFQWAMKHMWDDRGFFYYRVLRFCTIRTSYMRWSQAWMLLALSTFLSESDVASNPQAYAVQCVLADE